MYSNVWVIDFVSNPIDNDRIVIIDDTRKINFGFVFKTFTNGQTQDSAGNNLIPIGVNAQSTLAILLSRVYGIMGGNNYRFVRSGSSVTIQPLLKFTRTLFTNEADPRIAWGIDQQTYNDLIEIESITPIEGGVCSDTISYNIITNHRADRYRVGQEYFQNTTPSQSRAIAIQVNRATPYIIEVFNSPGFHTESSQQSLGAAFNVTNIQEDIRYTTTGTALVINHDFSASIQGSGIDPNKATYSINGTDYQSSNVFTEVADGSYTMYVKDGFGCVTTKDVLIDASTLASNNGFVLFEKANSIHWATEENIDFCNTYPNWRNTLSFTERGELNTKAEYLFQKCDTFTSQFKSSITNHKAFLVNCSTRVEIPVIRKSNNRLRTVENGAFRVNYNGKIAISFHIEEQNFARIPVPTYIKKDTFIELDLDGVGNYETYEITDIVKNNQYPLGIVVTSKDYTTPIPLLAYRYSYELQNYDIFEIPVVCGLLEGNYWLELESGSKISYSEVFNVKEIQENTKEIIAWNSENNEINYSTGITHLFRLPYAITKEPVPESEIDSLRTDTRKVHREGRVKDFWRFEFEYLNTYMVQKLSRIFVLDNIFIDREKYLLEGNLEIERIGRTNLYNISVVMEEQRETFNTNSASNLEINTQSGVIELSENGLGVIDNGTGGGIVVDGYTLG